MMGQRGHSYPTGKIISLLLATVLISLVGYLRFYHRPDSSSPHRHPTITPSAPAQQATKPTIHTNTALQKIIDAWAAGQSAHTAVVVRELTGDQRQASYHPATAMTTASTYKLYVAYAALHEVERGTYTLQTVTRTGQTVQAALNKMILQSDNTSAEALGFLIGWDRINALAAAIGATHTDINNYDSAGQPTMGDKRSTAGDLAALITKLQQGALLNHTDTQLLLGLMERQVWRERIPAGVPTGVAVADKPGWLSPADGVDEYVENDAAIVYGPSSTYVLIIMTDGGTTRPLTDLSQQIYNYLER